MYRPPDHGVQPGLHSSSVRRPFARLEEAARPVAHARGLPA